MINKEIQDDFFEGTEKTLEISFHSDFGVEWGLKTLTENQIKTLCNLANCSIISKISSNEVDAYILSESSIFIFKYKIIMKTCGSTTLLHCLHKLIEYSDALQMVLISFIYSRKNWTNPDSQIHPHDCFNKEIEYIDNTPIHERLETNHFILGSMNSDHLFIYEANICPMKKLSLTQYINSTGSRMNLSHSSHAATMFSKNQNITSNCTLNLMMFDLDFSFCFHFFEKNTKSAKEMTKNSGLSELFPCTTMDETSFSPYGYSMNATSNNNYYTVHITPQESCSYASLETNIKLYNFNSFINNVLSIFHPRRFIITLFGNETEFQTIPMEQKKIKIMNRGFFTRESVSTMQLSFEYSYNMGVYIMEE